MIQKLRVKFITASMLSLALVLLVILGGVNAMSYQKGGPGCRPNSGPAQRKPGRIPSADTAGWPRGKAWANSGLGPWVLSETPFESRFFSVLLNEKGQVLQSDTGQIAAVDDRSAGEMAQAVWASGNASGFRGTTAISARQKRKVPASSSWTAGEASPISGRP